MSAVMRRCAAALVAVCGVMLAASPAVARRRRSPKAPAASLATVLEPAANEACFSPLEPCDLKLVRFVQGAQKRLDVAIYDLNLDQLVHALAVAARRLPVRVVVDQRQAKGEHSQVALLARLGVAVRFGRQRGIMHNKFTIRDGARLETGSFNYTVHAATANNENQIYLDTPDVVARYQARFEQIWADAAPAGFAAAPEPPSSPAAAAPSPAAPAAASDDGEVGAAD